MITGLYHYQIDYFKFSQLMNLGLQKRWKRAPSILLWDKSTNILSRCPYFMSTAVSRKDKSVKAYETTSKGIMGNAGQRLLD